MESSLEVTELFGALNNCLSTLARLDAFPPELVQQYHQETRACYDLIPTLMEMLHLYFKQELQPLIDMLPDNVDYPDILWVRQWFIEPSYSVDEIKNVAIHIVKAAAEALALQCQVLKGFWESLCWSLLPIFKGCFSLQYFKFEFVSNHFNAWIINIVGDPEMCPNPDLRLQMLVLYRWLLKVDDSNREKAIESLMLACTFLDSHIETSNIVEMEDIIGCFWKFTEYDAEDSYLMQFGACVANKLRVHRNMRQQFFIHDLSHDYAMGLKVLPMPREFYSLSALLNYIKHSAFIQFTAFKREPDQSNLDKLARACDHISFFGEHLKSPFQEPELLNLTAEVVMYVMEPVVRCSYQSEPNLNGYDLFDEVNNMLCDLCHNYNGCAVIDEFTVLEPVGHEIIRRYKERICNIRTLISRELLDEVSFFRNILYNERY